MIERISDNIRATIALSVRSVRIFLKDKAGVFFSLLAPLIVFVLFVLFLGDVQIDQTKAIFQGMEYDEKALKAFVNCWMIAGVVSVACVTVSFSAQSIMIADRQNGNLSDIAVTPVRRTVISGAYFISNCLITFTILLCVFAVCFVYIAFTGWYMSAADVFAAVGVTVLSVLNASLISTFICTFLSSVNAHGAVTGIMSAVIGFLMGAYMPVSIFPKAVQYIVLFVPSAYSAGIFRNIFMRGALEKLTESLPFAKDALGDAFSLRIDFFGHDAGMGTMFAAFAVTFAIFAAALLITAALRGRKKIK